MKQRATPAVLLSLTLFLVLFPLMVHKPGLPITLKSDEPDYFLMSLSLARDGDLLCEHRDTRRWLDEFLLAEHRNLILMSDAARGKRRKVEEEEPTSTRPSPRDPVDIFTRQARLSWAKLIQRVYEVDPLLCPFCGADMKIIALVTDFATARAIRRSLKLPDQEPEPLAHGPPHDIELLDQTA